MKKTLIAFVAAVAMTGAAYAGCGVKIDKEGELSKYDAEKKVLTVGKEEITLAASATIKDAAGKDVKIEDLKGKKVKVSTDKHTKKGESVTEVKS